MRRLRKQGNNQKNKAARLPIKNVVYLKLLHFDSFFEDLFLFFTLFEIRTRGGGGG